MCCIVAKYFEETGWTIVKNRDRNYIPNVILTREEGLHLMVDLTTYYQEGINDHGVGVVSSSLMVIDDEKEYRKRMLSKGKKSKDGERIRNGLLAGDLESVTNKLIEEKLTGHTFICDKENLFVLEGAKDAHGEYNFILRNIDRSNYCVRTNHGIELSWAGYQSGPKRISSEKRLNCGKFIAVRATSPEQIIELMRSKWEEDWSLNICRRSNLKNGMKTVGQVVISNQQLNHYVIPQSS